jgi:hypothetical protein
MKKNLIEKFLNKHGYYKKGDFVQPVICKQDIYSSKMLGAKHVFSQRDWFNLNTEECQKITVEPFFEELYKFCEFKVQTDEIREEYIVTATLRILTKD